MDNIDLLHGLVVTVQEFFVLTWLLYSRPSTKYFFLTRHYFTSFVPHRTASWALGRQSCRVTYLLKSVSGLGRLLYSTISVLQGKSHLCIPFLGIARPQSRLRVSVGDLYIPRIGPYISCSRIGRSIVGIYKLLTYT